MALPSGRSPDEQSRTPRKSTRPSPRPIGCRHTSNIPPKNHRVWSEEKLRQLLLKGKITATKTTKMGNQRAPSGSISTTRSTGTIGNKTYRSRISQRYPLRPLQLCCDSSYKSMTRGKEITEHASGMRPSNRPTMGNERPLKPRKNKFQMNNSSCKIKQERKKQQNQGN